MQPVGAPESSCTDTPGWLDHHGYGCADYSPGHYSGECSNGAVTDPTYAGPKSNSPELNCCICGRPVAGDGGFVIAGFYTDPVPYHAGGLNGTRMLAVVKVLQTANVTSTDKPCCASVWEVKRAVNESEHELQEANAAENPA